MLAYKGKKASDYEARRSGSRKWELENEAFESIFPGDAKTVLDAPVGTGRFIPFYLSRGIVVTGIDLSSDMVEIAAEKGPSQLGIGDIRSLNFQNKSFDVAACIRLTGWLNPTDLRAATSELLRVAHKAVIGIRAADKASNKGRLWVHDKAYFLGLLAENGKSILDERVIKQDSYSIYLCG
jgi:ubiquinone/menaquinone biosynthesis C-methylase UbiE